MSLYVGNAHYIEFSGSDILRDSNNDPVTGATVNVTIYPLGSDTPISGMTWPLTLNDDGSGVYSGTINGDIDITPGKDYNIEVSVESVSGTKAKWILTEEAIYR